MVTYLADGNFENWKSHLSCLWRQKHKQSVSSVGGKFTTLELFFVENKDWIKTEIAYFFFFKEKITLKQLKKVRSSEPRVRLYVLSILLSCRYLKNSGKGVFLWILRNFLEKRTEAKYFRKKAWLQMFDWILNMPVISMSRKLIKTYYFVTKAITTS